MPSIPAPPGTEPSGNWGAPLPPAPPSQPFWNAPQPQQSWNPPANIPFSSMVNILMDQF